MKHTRPFGEPTFPFLLRNDWYVIFSYTCAVFQVPFLWCPLSLAVFDPITMARHKRMIAKITEPNTLTLSRILYTPLTTAYYHKPSVYQFRDFHNQMNSLIFRSNRIFPIVFWTDNIDIAPMNLQSTQLWYLTIKWYSPR